MGHMTEFRVLAILLLGLLAAPPAQARTAVIVNSENPVDSVSRQELKRIYKGDITRWDFASESKLLVGLRISVKTATCFGVKVATPRSAATLVGLGWV